MGNFIILIGIMKDVDISNESFLADLNDQLFQESILFKLSWIFFLNVNPNFLHTKGGP